MSENSLLSITHLKEFTISPWWSTSCLWGGGWEPGKDPASQGWRKRRLHPGNNEYVLVGIPNRKGCFSARVMGDGRLDVALYEEWTPQEVLEGLSTLSDVIYMTVDHYPGWALTVREKLNELLALEEGMEAL